MQSKKLSIWTKPCSRLYLVIFIFACMIDWFSCSWRMFIGAMRMRVCAQLFFSEEIDKTRLCCMQPDGGVSAFKNYEKIRYYWSALYKFSRVCVAQVATIHNTHMCAYNGLSSVPSFLPMQINTYATISINIFICGPIIFIDKVSVRLPAICSPLHFSFSYFLPFCRIEHETIQ